MNELSLFTGAGGGILGTYLLGFRPIGYVEWDGYCQQVLAQRIKDGILHEAPIFCDVRAFISEGYAASYTGMVDVLTAGFPCQPFSLAGKRQGDEDARNMWPATIECIRIIRPRYALLENVPGLLAHEYIRRIFGDLAEGGYDVRWRVLSAAELGAPHKRDRLWIVADTCRTGLPEPTCGRIGSISEAAGAPEGRESRRENAAQGAYWATEPNVGRVANGVASRVDRLKAIGNGQVPEVVRTAWEILARN